VVLNVCTGQIIDPPQNGHTRSWLVIVCDWRFDKPHAPQNEIRKIKECKTLARKTTPDLGCSEKRL
jgi:hypothetical protein